MIDLPKIDHGCAKERTVLLSEQRRQFSRVPHRDRGLVELAGERQLYPQPLKGAVTGAPVPVILYQSVRPI